VAGSTGDHFHWNSNRPGFSQKDPRRPCRWVHAKNAGWRKIAIAMAGDQYQIGQPSVEAPDAGAPVPGLKTFYVDTLNQNFYSLPLAPGDHARERLGLIDQLLEATADNPAAQAALQSARANLAQIVAN